MKNRVNRQKLLEKDLLEYNPRKWNFNLPIKNYTVRTEDIIPAISGAIGKISLAAAFAVAWSSLLNISDQTFVTENVRLEIVVGSIFALMFSALLNPKAGPPGTLAPLIPLIPLMAASGVHPLPLSILIGVMGIILSAIRLFSRIVEINGEGTKSGIMLLFGFLGISSSYNNLSAWAQTNKTPNMLIILLILGLIINIILHKLKAKWLIIPACAVISLVVSLSFKIYPSLNTELGLPIINPHIWWNEKWGIGYGLTAINFIKALPYALLAVVMWPVDALAVKAIQETNYPKNAENAMFDMNATYMVVSLRNIAGSILGGAQVSAIWRSFMIPLGIVKRPIGASALILGVMGGIFGILGFPIDIAVFPPLLWIVLIFGVYAPMIEVGLGLLIRPSSPQIATLCVITGLTVNPVLAWVISVFVENFLIDKADSERIITKADRFLSACLIVISIVAFMLVYIL